MFRCSTPAVASGHELTAKELLARGAARVDRDLAAQPRALAELHSELGDIFNEMVDNTTAMSHLQARARPALRDWVSPTAAPHWKRCFVAASSTWTRRSGRWRARISIRLLARGLAVYGPRHRWAVGAREKLTFIHLENDENEAAVAVAPRGAGAAGGRGPGERLRCGACG